MRRRALGIVALLGAMLALGEGGVLPASAATAGYSSLSICPAARPGHATCMARALTRSGQRVRPAIGGAVQPDFGPTGIGLDPGQIASAYGLPAVATAVALGASEVSLSWGGSEDPGQTVYDATLDHPGVAITAATGDDGFAAGASYPATSPYVTAVGGTTLSPASGGGWTETAWSGGGSGCSAVEPKPAWQHDTLCTRRTEADVAAVADPYTGLDVYSEGSWQVIGGTSLSTPLVA